jgi:hypothetical protein
VVDGEGGIAHAVVNLVCQHNLIAASGALSKPVANNGFRTATIRSATIDISGIDEVDAQFQHTIHNQALRPAPKMNVGDSLTFVGHASAAIYK